MQADPTQVPLDEKQKALLLFVLKACDNPHSVSAEDMDRLRSLGWSEVDVVDSGGSRCENGRDQHHFRHVQNRQRIVPVRGTI